MLDHPQALLKGAFKGVQRQMLERIALLSESIYEQKRSAIIVFEGWDAAGKGTTIRALTERLDARGYKVLATQAPRTHEKQKPWLWRFWMNLPRYGQIAIFDRSWYGRVMVERIEGFCREVEWKRAYREINQFERQLVDFGTVVFKFWVHISKEEQLKRFTERADTPYKVWKLTDEDWRNREKWDRYEEAVDEMLLKTSTLSAPWTIVEGNNKWWARVRVLRTVVESLSRELDFVPDILKVKGEKKSSKKK